MEKIDTDYKQWNLEVHAKLFKPFNHDCAPLSSLVNERERRLGTSQSLCWMTLSCTCYADLAAPTTLTLRLAAERIEKRCSRSWLPWSHRQTQKLAWLSFQTVTPDSLKHHKNKLQPGLHLHVFGPSSHVPPVELQLRHNPVYTVQFSPLQSLSHSHMSGWWLHRPWVHGTLHSLMVSQLTPSGIYVEGQNT